MAYSYKVDGWLGLPLARKLERFPKDLSVAMTHIAHTPQKNLEWKILTLFLVLLQSFFTPEKLSFSGDK